MMRAHRVAGLAAILLFSVAGLRAQQSAAQPAKSPAQPQAQSAPTSADAMGVSLKNIRRQVKQEPGTPKASGTGLRYDFFVDVWGKRPAINFFKDYDLSTGGTVRWGGVTHQEILNAVTPYNFRAITGGFDVLAPRK
jgi:hypothetical protein